MRRFFAFLAVVAVVAVPAGAFAAATDTDGTLVVTNGDGTVTMNLRGALIGTVADGKVTLTDPAETNTDDLVIKGCDPQKVADNKIACSGTDLRYRVIQGRFRLKIVGSGINLSVVGNGQGFTNPVSIQGDDQYDQARDGQLGTYKWNDDAAKRITNKTPINLPLGG
jgi:hypothetical protein